MTAKQIIAEVRAGRYEWVKSTLTEALEKTIREKVSRGHSSYKIAEDLRIPRGLVRSVGRRLELSFGSDRSTKVKR